MKVRTIKRRTNARHAHALQWREWFRRCMMNEIQRKINAALQAAIVKLYEPLFAAVRGMHDVFIGSVGGACSAQALVAGGINR